MYLLLKKKIKKKKKKKKEKKKKKKKKKQETFPSIICLSRYFCPTQMCLLGLTRKRETLESGYLQTVDSSCFLIHCPSKENSVPATKKEKKKKKTKKKKRKKK